MLTEFNNVFNESKIQIECIKRWYLKILEKQQLDKRKENQKKGGDILVK